MLRKGGIRESSFQVEHPLVWLYPTYEHQKPELLKPEYAEVKPVPSGWHPTLVKIASCAQITKVLTIDTLEQIQKLQPYHVWQEQTIYDRLKWKPQQPLKVLLLRVYALAEPQEIAFDSSYGGCKSWIELVEPISTNNSIPVLEAAEFARQVEQIKSAIA